MKTSIMLLTTSACLILALFLAFTFENHINDQYHSCGWCAEFGEYAQQTSKTAWGIPAQDMLRLVPILIVATACVFGLSLFIKPREEKGGF